MAAPLADFRAPLDLELLRLLNRDAGSAADAAARVLSSHAFGVGFGILLALLVWQLQRRAALRAVLALGLAVGLSDAVGSQLIRPLFGRLRPCYAMPGAVRQLLPAANIPALPSLHAANLFALALVATLAERRLAPIAYLGAALVALSRVYGGVHWPSDVVAGAAWGSLCGLLAWAVAGRAERALARRS